MGWGRGKKVAEVDGLEIYIEPYMPKEACETQFGGKVIDIPTSNGGRVQACVYALKQNPDGHREIVPIEKVGNIKVSELFVRTIKESGGEK